MVRTLCDSLTPNKLISYQCGTLFFNILEHIVIAKWYNSI